MEAHRIYYNDFHKLDSSMVCVMIVCIYVYVYLYISIYIYIYIYIFIYIYIYMYLCIYYLFLYVYIYIYIHIYSIYIGLTRTLLYKITASCPPPPLGKRTIAVLSDGFRHFLRRGYSARDVCVKNVILQNYDYLQCYPPPPHPTPPHPAPFRWGSNQGSSLQVPSYFGRAISRTSLKHDYLTLPPQPPSAIGERTIAVLPCWFRHFLRWRCSRRDVCVDFFY